MYKDKSLLVIFIVIIQTLIVIFINNDILASTEISTLKNRIPFVNIAILAMAILSIVCIKGIEETAGYRIKANLMQSHLQQLESLLKASQSQRHEFTRHIQALQSLVGLNRIEEAQEYLDAVSEDYWPDNVVIFTSNPTLAGLINSKYYLAQLENIDFTVSIQNDYISCPVPAWDLGSIVGNLLDNAIEAALQDKRQPWVKAEFDFSDGNYIILVENNGPVIDNYTIVFEPGFTTKGSDSRGYGLYLVKQLVAKYKGEITVTSQSTTKIVVTIPDKEADSDSQFCANVGRQHRQELGYNG